MSSSAAVEVIAIKETVYGQTPDLATVDGNTVRYTSESLSGTPITTTSAELRSDRMSSGQVITGLESGGDINFELSIDDLYEAFMAGAMMNDWVLGPSGPLTSTQFTKDATNPQLATITISGDTGDIDGNGRALEIGDVVVLGGFTNAANNGPVQITQIIDTSTVQAVVARASVSELAAAGTFIMGDYVDIGSLIPSWTLSKAYTDVVHMATTDQHSQRYTGSIVNGMSINIAYGEIVNGTFSFLSNGYVQEYPSLHQRVDAAGGTIEEAGTSEPLNGSIDMPLVTVGGQPTDFCIQSVGLELSNNATPQNCIGLIAPAKYNLGTVSINITASIYLGDQSYDKFMPGKLTMEPTSFVFAAVDEDHGYAFDLRAVQLSFPDPAASGDTPVLIEASGVAKVAAGGASALRIWRW